MSGTTFTYIKNKLIFKFIGIIGTILCIGLKKFIPFYTYFHGVKHIFPNFGNKS